jgi:exopolyphosphatase/guanosine-5'-triphosphate,3'-diphosphate pyrophosphatase
MAKRTAVIDIGSNSARMAVYEKESRFAFRLLKEIKAKVRIGEGAYEKGGYLQEHALERAMEALSSFHDIARHLRCNKILCVATSAVRDAPNANLFVNEAKKRFGFHIRVIDGQKEAYYGALAVTNMLPPLADATAIDIGGGSTEISKIQNGKIVRSVSLDIGTVRLKELFFDKKASPSEVEKFIDKQLKTLGHDYDSTTIIGIGGTIRALGKLFIGKGNYPLSTVHGYEYSSKQSFETIRKISQASVLNLKSFGVKKDRYDTIREGCAIFGALLDKFGAKRVITSGVGVREGVYLADLLRGSHGRFPPNFCLSLESLKARFGLDEARVKIITKSVTRLFTALKNQHKLSDELLPPLLSAAKIESIGETLSFYQEHLHGSYFILNNLNYGFTHKDKVLISFILKFYDKKITQNDIFYFKQLLPSLAELNWLEFIFSLAKILYTNAAYTNPDFEVISGALLIKGDIPQLAQNAIKKMDRPQSFAIKFAK